MPNFFVQALNNMEEANGYTTTTGTTSTSSTTSSFLQALNNVAVANGYLPSTTTTSSNTLTNILNGIAQSNGSISTVPITYTTTGAVANTPSTQMILSKFQNSINSAAVYSSLNEYGSKPLISSTAVIPDVDAIAQSITNKKGSSLDIDTQVQQYLLDNYGGSPAAVIMNLSGARTLPPQVLTMQNQLMQQAVMKLSMQVREKVYANQSSKSDSLLLDDSDSSDSSSSSTSSVLDSSSDVYDVF